MHLAVVLQTFLVFAMIISSKAFFSFKTPSVAVTSSSFLTPSNPIITKRMMCTSIPGLDDRTKEQIEELIKSNKVVLFMKGNKLFPQWCGWFLKFA